jgi:hypothetical protein
MPCESLAELFFDHVTKSSETCPAVQSSARGEVVVLSTISRRQNNILNSILFTVDKCFQVES